MWPGPYGNWGSRKYLISSLDQSLRRMGLDYVDVFYSHRFDPETPLEETLQALVDIVRQGKALYAGISRWPKEVAEYAFRYLKERDTPCLLFQDRYNLFDRSVAESGVLDSVADNGSGFIAFSPLAQGILTNRYLNGIPADSRAAGSRSLSSAQITPQIIAKVSALNDIAAKRGQTLAQMALAWVLSDNRVTSVIVGCSSVAQLQDSIRSIGNTTFSDEEMSLIDKICV